MWDRRGWLRLSTAACLGAGLPLTHAQNAPFVAQPKGAAGRLVVVVENKAAFCFLPLTIAERLGYFAHEGLDLEVRELSDTSQCVQALLTGSAQVYSGVYSSTLSLQSRGLMFQSLVLLGRAPQLAMGVSLRTMGSYRQLRDLRGKRLGVQGLGSGSHKVARLLMARAGMGPQEIQYIGLLDHAQAVAAFRSGQLDAICYADPVITALEQGADLRIVADTRTVQGTVDVFGGAMPSASLLAQDEYISNHPRQCQALADAMVRSLKWLQTAGPSDLIKTVPERYFAGDRALYLAAFSRAREAWTPDGLMPEEGPGTAARTHARLDPGQQILRVDLARTFTNEFARKAKQRFRA
jgi:NitT/TauT family transport system substrate-binding protein